MNNVEQLEQEKVRSRRSEVWSTVLDSKSPEVQIKSGSIQLRQFAS